MKQVILTNVIVGKDANVNQSKTAASFSVAHTSRYLDRVTNEKKSTTEWFQINCFGNLVKLAEGYIKKGMRINVIAHLQQKDYTDKNGNKTYGVNIVADDIDFCQSKATNDAREEKRNEGFMSIPDGMGDGVPFN